MAVQYDTWYYGVFYHPSDPTLDYYYKSLGLPVPIGATGVDLVLFGLQKATKAEYDAAKALNGTCPGAGSEIPRPTNPIGPTLQFYEYGFVWDSGNKSMYMLARADQGLQVEFFLKAEDGQTEPISGFQYLQGATVSMSVAGTAMNQGSLHGAGAIAPGNWTLYARNAGDTANDTRKSMRITLPSFTNGGAVQAHSESYFLAGNYAAPEGGSTLLSLYKYAAGVQTGPSNVGFSGVPSGKGLSQSQNSNALTINVSANAVQGDSFNFPLVATVNGTQVLTQTISILDKTAGDAVKPPIVTPTDRVDAIAVQTIPASSDPQSLVTVWLYWKVTGNPVLWVGMYGNNNSVLYEGTDYLTGDYGDGYTRALRTVQQSRGNALRYVARLGSSTGTKVVDKTFDTSFPGTGKEVQYSANEIYVEASSADFEGDSSGPSPDPSGDGFDNSYAFTYTGPNADANGTTIQRSAAPKVVAVDRTKPRLDGNNYPFAVQTALNAFVSQRLPTVSIDPAKLMVNYVGMDVNDGTFRGSVIGRGYNTISDPTPNRGSYGRRDRLVLNINGGYDIAQAAASALPGSDARKVLLQKWYQDGVDASGQPIHRLIVDGPAAELFGRALYADQTAAQNTDWTMGAPIYAYTPNFEVGIAPAGSGISDEQARMDMIGLVMRGIRKQAIDQGLTPPVFIAYDHGGICHFNVSLISKDITTPNGTYTEDGGNTPYTNADVNVPAYYLPGRLSIAFKGGTADAPMATTNDMVSYGKEFGALYGSQEYPNSTNDDQPIWLKGNDGKPTVRTVTNFDGKPVKLLNYRTDARRTIIMGETADLLGPAPYYICEGAAWLEEIYTRATYVVVQYDVRAGNEYMALSNVRQPGFEKIGLVMWTRMDAEFKHPVRLQKPDGSGEKMNPATGQPYSQEVLNTRPLNPDSVEFDFLWSTVVGLVDAYRNWMGPQPLIVKQGDSSPGNNHARGNYEIQQKAMNRYSEVQWIKSNIVRPMVGELPIRNFARDRTWHNWNDEPEKKMLMGGVFCPARTDKNNKPWIVLCAAYPAQDVDMQTTVTLWPTNTSGQAIGGSYVFRVKGRKTYLDAFQLPDGYATLANAQWRYQYTDLTGDVRTRTLDWNSPIPTTNLTPPAAA